MAAVAGQGEGFCGDQRFPVRAGDIVVFPPRSVHGIDVSEDARMYCLELMQPNDMFAGALQAMHCTCDIAAHTGPCKKDRIRGKDVPACRFIKCSSIC